MEIAPEEIGKAAGFFPLVGLVIGVLLFLSAWILNLFAPGEITGVLVLALWILLTRGLHLDGLADTVDGLGAHGEREKVFQAMKDSRIGSFAVVAVFLVLVLKLRGLDLLISSSPIALTLSPMLGRWSAVLLAHRSVPAHEGLGQNLIQSLDLRAPFFAAASALVFALLFHGFRGLGSWVAVFVLAYLFKRYLHRRLGGITGDHFGFLIETSEALTLLCLVFPQS